MSIRTECTGQDRRGPVDVAAGLFDVHRASDLIAIGREATQKAMPDLRDDVGLYPAPPGAPSLV